jgi:hypothetical protein
LNFFVVEAYVEDMSAAVGLPFLVMAVQNQAKFKLNSKVMKTGNTSSK